MSKAHLRILKQMVDLPTAPFVETHVVRYIEDFVAARPQLRLRRDRFGNLMVKYTPKRPAKKLGRPVLFAAHMDHPGFIARRMIDGRHVEAEWHGGVKWPYFRNAKVKFHVDGAWVPGRIVAANRPPTRKNAKRLTAAAKKAAALAPPKTIVAKVGGVIAPGSPGMWDLPDATIRDNRLHARVCDDIAALAGIICMLDEICRNGGRAPTYAFFTRAEEVGFAGALAAVADKTIPRRTLVVAVENSLAITGVGMGDGPVLRVGDRLSVFTPAVAAYCRVVADRLAEDDKTFKYQRKLMDGGACESTAYCHYGYDATGICLPLVNYHNMDTKTGRIAPEAIDVRDFRNLTQWFVALARSPATLKYDGSHPGLDAKLDGLLKQWRGRLVKTAKL